MVVNEDASVVIANSLTHSNDANEFDASYLEFLIQLQHRDITPEDYEYLTRLDEQIKKKTLDDAILERLRTVTIDKTMLTRADNDCCGICLDGYQVGQIVKYLPCNHRFHADCIDKWLRNSSVNCPLDNLPINGNKVGAVNEIETKVEDEIIFCDELDDDNEKSQILNLLIKC